MKLGKAPAFQFYYDRFFSSTGLWEDSQVGQYIRCLCVQANKGFITEKEFKRLTDDEEVMAKFHEIAPGKFANKVLNEIIDQREIFAESRRQNRLKKERLEKDRDQTILRQQEDNVKTESSQKKDYVDVVVDVVLEEEVEVKKELKIKREDVKAKTREGLIADARIVLDHLNQVASRNYETDNKYHLQHLLPRLQEYGFQMAVDVVDCMTFKWKGTDMDQYLRPSTLFAAKNFAKYRDEVRLAKATGTMPTQGKKLKKKTAAEIMKDALASKDQPNVI